MSKNTEQLNNASTVVADSDSLTSDAGRAIEYRDRAIDDRMTKYAYACSCERVKGRYAYRFFKRLFDIIFSAAVIIVLFIPSLILGFAIRKESSGPAIYKRWCVGLNGKPFPMYKFRTMRIEPPEEILSPEQYQQWKKEVKVDNDPRITSIGKRIRSMSIDELPQFMNVFNGTMSAVGPRPVTAEEAERYGEYKDELLSVKPGITGYWQVYGRGETEYGDDSTRLRMQMYYVRNRSMFLDAKIIVKTVGAILKKTGE